MPSYKVTGIDKYLAKLSRLEDKSIMMEVIGKSIYKGAEVIADNTKIALRSLAVDNRQKIGANEKLVSINQLQKNGLIDSYGIAKLRDDNGYLNVKVGFDGYNKLVTYRWPKGQPNAMIARSLESGTSFMSKNPVISRTQSKYKQQCLSSISDELVKQIDDIFEKE